MKIKESNPWKKNKNKNIVTEQQKQSSVDKQKWFNEAEAESAALMSYIIDIYHYSNINTNNKRNQTTITHKEKVKLCLTWL